MGAGDRNFTFAHGAEAQQKDVLRGFYGVKIFFYSIDGDLSFPEFSDQLIGVPAGADADDDMRSGRRIDDFQPVAQAGVYTVDQKAAFFFHLSG